MCPCIYLCLHAYLLNCVFAFTQLCLCMYSTVYLHLLNCVLVFTQLCLCTNSTVSVYQLNRVFVFTQLCSLIYCGRAKSICLVLGLLYSHFYLLHWHRYSLIRYSAYRATANHASNKWQELYINLFFWICKIIKDC